MQFNFPTTASMAMLMSLMTASLSTASPILAQRASNASTDSWPVSGFTVGCSPAACVYNFAVTRATGSYNPGFNTTCTGNDYTSDWQACADTDISAKIVPVGSPFWQVFVKQHYITADREGWVDAKANATIEETVSQFIVTIYETESVE